MPAVKRALIVVLALLGFVAVGVLLSPAGRPYLDRLLGKPSAGETRAGAVASVDTLHKRVKHRDARAFEWKDAQLKMPLADGDKIQTEEASRAGVLFDDGSALQIDELSLVTIRAPAQGDGESLVASIEIDDGRVRASMPAGAKGKTMRVRTKDGVESVLEAAEDTATEFSVLIARDRSSRILIHRGKARVVGQGKTIELGEGQSATASKSTIEVVSDASILSAPVPTRPADGAQAGPGAVTLAWKPVPGAERYLVEIARDDDFRDMVAVLNLLGQSYELEPDAEAEYRWRVTGMTPDGVPGRSSLTRRFRFSRASPSPSPTPVVVATKPRVKSTLPPPSVISWKPGAPMVVTGVTKPGARVMVHGKPADVDGKGRYSIELSNLPPNTKSITIQEIGVDGNVTYKKRPVVVR